MLINSDNFGEATEWFSRQKRLIVDTETDGLRPWHGNRLCGISMTDPKLQVKAYYPFRHEPGGNLSLGHLRKLLRMLSRKRMSFWNAKFDISMMHVDGLKLPRTAEDGVFSAHLLNENEPNFKLKPYAVDYLGEWAGEANDKLTDILVSHGFGKDDIWRLSPDQVEPYACMDVELPERLRRIHVPALREWRLYNIWRGINLYSMAMLRLEKKGMQLDTHRIHKNMEEANEMVVPAEAILHELAGYKINPRSNPQIHEFLGLDHADIDTLTRILESKQDNDPPDRLDMYRAIEALLDYRGWAKVNNTYYRPYLEQHMDDNEVLHPNIKLHGTVAGRPSVSKPALQAVPRRTEVYKVKDVFIARPGRVLISADYSQAELRLGAHYSKDPYLLKCFKEGKNIHQMTAKILGIPYDFAKRINFAVVYGSGPKNLAQKLHIALQEARRFLDRAHQRHHTYRPLYQAIQNKALEDGYIRLWTGRCRHYNTDATMRATYKALSNFIQGGVAEIMRLAIMRIDVELVQTGKADMLLQVHDQIIMETDADNKYPVMQTMREIMCDFPQFDVPLKADISYGKRWGRLRKWKSAA